MAKPISVPVYILSFSSPRIDFLHPSFPIDLFRLHFRFILHPLAILYYLLPLPSTSRFYSFALWYSLNFPNSVAYAPCLLHPTILLHPPPPRSTLLYSISLTATSGLLSVHINSFNFWPLLLVRSVFNIQLVRLLLLLLLAVLLVLLLPMLLLCPYPTIPCPSPSAFAFSFFAVFVQSWILLLSILRLPGSVRRSSPSPSSGCTGFLCGRLVTLVTLL